MKSKKSKHRIEISEELYEFLKEYCEWAGHDMEWYVGYSLVDSIRMDLDYVRSILISRGCELWFV